MEGQFAQYRYVLVNTLVSLLAFGRNLLFMKTLGLADLGQVALMQTIVMLVGFLQLGTINGAYVLLAEDKPEQTQRIATVLNLGLALLFGLFGLFALAGWGQALMPVVASQTLIIGVSAGLAALASTWMNNLLIAKKALGHSNIINIVAVTISLLTAFMSAPWGLAAALASISMQPFLVALGALIVAPETRTIRAKPDVATLRLVWSVGIWQFLGGLSVLMTLQVERWSISMLLGNDQLGQFYLVMMFATFFQLVPAALMNVYLPKVIQAASNDKVRLLLRRHLQEVLVFSGLVLLAVLALAPGAVRLLLPQFEGSIPLLVLAYPGLMIVAVSGNATLTLYATRRMRALMVYGLLLLVSYTALLGVAALTGHFSLETVVILRGVAAAVAGLYLFWASRAVLAERR